VTSQVLQNYTITVFCMAFGPKHHTTRCFLTVPGAGIVAPANIVSIYYNVHKHRVVWRLEHCNIYFWKIVNK
jgi:hypothetical protein